MRYMKVQYGWFWLPTLLLFVGINIPSFSAPETPGWLIASIVAFEVVIVAVVLWFSRLEVSVGADFVSASFGRGRPERRFDLSEITSMTRERNKWYYGFGVRYLTNTTIYNTWGLDCVELQLVSGKRFRIGTSDPSGLVKALASAGVRQSEG